MGGENWLPSRPLNVLRHLLLFLFYPIPRVFFTPGWILSRIHEAAVEGSEKGMAQLAVAEGLPRVVGTQARVVAAVSVTVRGLFSAADIETSGN